MSSWFGFNRRTTAFAAASLALIYTGWHLYQQYQEPQIQKRLPLSATPTTANDVKHEKGTAEDDGPPQERRSGENRRSRAEQTQPAQEFVSRFGTLHSHMQERDTTPFQHDEAIEKTGIVHPENTQEAVLAWNRDVSEYRESGDRKTDGDEGGRNEDAENENDENEYKEDGNDENEDSEDESEDDDPLAVFQETINTIEFDKLEKVALEIRWKSMPLDHRISVPTCSINPIPKFGSYNLAYIITFADDTKWVARIPGNGHCLGKLHQEKMEIEYKTMGHIQEHTTIPLPQVFYWNCDASQIGTAFALISFIDGVPLNEVWHTAFDEDQRLKVLSDIAGHMVQLQNLRFDKIGMLRFVDNSLIPQIGSDIFITNDETNVWGPAGSRGPYSTLHEYLWDGWDHAPDTKRGRSDLPILKLAIESIPGYLIPDGRNYLSPCDLNFQNVFVNSDGTVTGFIDWDGVETMPITLGCGRYPSWITRDWDPAMYVYGYDGPDQDEYWEESSPEELSRYRQHYATAYAEYARRMDDYDPRMTRLSHLVEAIDIAVHSRFNRCGIVSKLLEHAFGESQTFDLCDYADAYEEDRTEEMDVKIKEAFGKMWHAEWEKFA